MVLASRFLFVSRRLHCPVILSDCVVRLYCPVVLSSCTNSSLVDCIIYKQRRFKDKERLVEEAVVEA